MQRVTVRVGGVAGLKMKCKVLRPGTCWRQVGGSMGRFLSLAREAAGEERMLQPSIQVLQREPHRKLCPHHSCLDFCVSVFSLDMDFQQMEAILQNRS